MSIHQPAQTYRQCRVITEASPLSLGRIFSVVTLLNLVPAHSWSCRNPDGSQSLELGFEDASEREFDLLLRKIAQLTETFSVQESQGSCRQVRVA